MQLREAAAVARERPALAGGPPPGLVGLHLQVNDRVGRERSADPLRAEGSATERDHPGVGPREQLERHLLLARAKRVLALPVEEGLERLAEPPLQLAVRIERLRTELGCERASAGGLAGAHETDENECYARLQPMRSSYAASAAFASSMLSPPSFSR